VTQIPILSFERRERDRVVAGVCGGAADALGVDPTLVRLVFAVLALAGGAGILLYFALWVWTSSRRPVLAVLILAAATMALLQSLGVPTAVVIGAGLMVGGIVLLARRGATLRPGGSRLFVPGIALAMGGAVLMLDHLGSSRPFVGPGALAGALALILGPYLWQLAAERTERIRLAERAAMAARIHDSVLQTLALVQRDADDAPRVRALARRQERELRRWLYGRGYDGATTVADALADAVAEVEGAHLTQIELATSGDAPLDGALGELVLAAREAMVNAAKHAQSDEISVYAEVEDAAVAIYVRDRGIGFDQAAVAADRRGIAESIEGPQRAAGGSATITSSPGNGTEVELTMPRGGES
jgi:signal transduction histidine kinase